MAFEVTGESVRRVADVSKENGFPSLREEEQTIKFLKQNGRGLVDGTEDSLALVGELSEKSTDGPGCLTVKT